MIFQALFTGEDRFHQRTVQKEKNERRNDRVEKQMKALIPNHVRWIGEIRIANHLAGRRRMKTIENQYVKIDHVEEKAQTDAEQRRVAALTNELKMSDFLDQKVSIQRAEDENPRRGLQCGES